MTGSHIPMPEVRNARPDRAYGRPTIRSVHETAKIVDIRNLTKTFVRANGQIVTPLDNISMTVGRGEFLVLLGPSGCGKTTLLRCIAGLERPAGGEIFIRGDSVFSTEGAGINVPPERRFLSMIFQSYALWPHLTVSQNVAFPLRYVRPRPSRSSSKDRVKRALGMAGVADVADQHPGQLSGGQQQRVALARALVSESEVILFDEPLSNVDAKVRAELRLELIELQHRIGFAAIYVTHDQAEAMELSDRIAVLNAGKIEQLDTPRGIYMRPLTRYVAHFTGRANEIRGTIATVDAEIVRISTEAGSLQVRVASDHCWEAGDECYVVWRPQYSRVIGPGVSAGDGLQATVVLHRFLGVLTEVVCTTATGIELVCTTTTPMDLAEGQAVCVAVPEDALIFAPEPEGRRKAGPTE